MKSQTRSIVVIGAAILAGAWGMSVAALASDAPSAGVSATSAQANATPQSADGHYLFRTYCASCHGTSAIGDGPLAASMRRPPANLAEIAKRNDGVYDSELVYRVIDGRQRVRGHGGPDMPVWGDAFFRTIDGGSEETGRLKEGMAIDTVFTFEPVDASTRVRAEFVLGSHGLPPGLLTPLGWAIAGKVKDVISRDLADLKQSMETQPA